MNISFTGVRAYAQRKDLRMDTKTRAEIEIQIANPPSDIRKKGAYVFSRTERQWFLWGDYITTLYAVDGNESKELKATRNKIKGIDKAIYQFGGEDKFAILRLEFEKFLRNKLEYLEDSLLRKARPKL